MTEEQLFIQTTVQYSVSTVQTDITVRLSQPLRVIEIGSAMNNYGQ